MRESQKIEQNAVVVTCAGGLETLLQDEIEEITGTSATLLSGGVRVQVELTGLYNICLWSRLAARVLLPLAEFEFRDEDHFYAQMHTLPWLTHFDAEVSLSISLSTHRKVTRHERFFTYRAKDAVVDQVRERTGQRPVINTRDPDIRIHVHLASDTQAEVSLDLSGAPLHQRGYRRAHTDAPMKETLAAALLRFSGWHQAPLGARLIDPLCGSGTVLIEAALMQADMAPGLMRRKFGFECWRAHSESVWQAAVAAAATRDRSETVTLNLKGFDANLAAIKAAQANIAAAGLEGSIHVERRDLSRFHVHASAESEPGWLVTNPPYGERLDQNESLLYLYRGLARRLQGFGCAGWHMGLITNQVELADALQLEEPITLKTFNGPIRCFFRAGTVVPRHGFFNPVDVELAPVTEVATEVPAPDLQNRIMKNVKGLQRWQRREGIHALRLYDADIPEYNLAVDWYNGRLHVQEYAPPAKVDADKAKARLDAAVTTLQQMFRLPDARLYLKSRSRQRGKGQYGKLGQKQQFHLIEEQGAMLLVNLDDYLDTGLFLDHRPTRQRLQSLCAGKRFLNLFCYTGAATVHAGIGGARHSVSVDLSPNYLKWARSNLYLNGLAEEMHSLVQSDCLAYLRGCREQFDVIFVDPPTFSNSKRTRNVFDVQEAQVELIDLAMKRLEPGGLLIFSNNFHRFQLAPELTERYAVKDITRASLPPDFGRGRPAHQCWEFQHQ